MDDEREFFSADELLFDPNISAALADETFQPWRVDPETGTQWYRLIKSPMIRAVPDQSAEIINGFELRGGDQG